MSLRINLDQLNENKKKDILKDLTFRKENDQEAYSFDIKHPDLLAVPYNYGFDKLKISQPLKNNYTTAKFNFKGQLKDEQKEVRKELVTHLNKQGTSILSCGVGFGKTITSINITSKIGLRTLVLVNRLILLEQWKESIERFTDATTHIIQPGKKIKYADIYIINGQNISKIDPDFLKTIGFVVIDELHLLMTEVIIKNILCLTPKYFLGLSATPYRNDCFDDVINQFFGKKRVHRKLNKKHIVYRINTKFTPEYDTQYNGKINWNSVLNSQAFSPERNKIIINIINNFKDRNFLVLVKRIDQGKYLINELQKQGHKVDSLLGKEKYVETDNKILIGTTNKISTGFDCKKLDTLIIAADIQSYFIQSLGRIFRRPDNDPKIFDLVDNNNILKSHWAARRKVYIEHGGEVKYFDKEFPNLNIIK